MSANAFVTPNLFRAVKILLEGGATRKEAAEFMKVSKATIDRIAASEDFDDYKNRVNAFLYKKKAEAEKKAKEKAEKEKAEKAKEEVTQDSVQPAQQEQTKQIVHNVTVQATHYMMQEMQKTNELLKFISNELGFIVDELTRSEEDEP